ncbi:MAG TPA: tetratricopeptide repeat protein [Terriglobia bacterium]|nr:tetratricopeptide repeat protein [Terriglobia bacterium]
MAFNKAKAMQEAEKSVGQGKTAQAIKQYLFVFEKDPADLGLLNTVGDLYVRDKNMPEALKYFHKLADSYTQEGFTVKAIAIYKKISKLDPSGVDVLLKMAELYTVQGLSREAREQFAQAVEYYKKKNQNDKALEIFRKIVALDPENTNYRIRMAEFYENMGKKPEATKTYVEVVEIALRRGDAAATDLALKKALNLDPQNPQLLLLRARMALAKNQPDEVEKILEPSPELKSNPAARQILLDAYLAGHKLEAAEKMVVEVFRSNPADFSSLGAYADLCAANNEFDAAVKPLAAVADTMIEQGNTAPLMEALRRIWAKAPDHIPTLELVNKVSEKTADEFTLPEILEALGSAYVKVGALEKAEKIYRQLVGREPENEQLKGLLKQVLQKEGKEPESAKPEDLSNVEMALTPAAEAGTATGPAPAADPEQAALLKEAMDNCDLFTRYGLMDKAFAELDKALAVYPEQIELHQRMLEISSKANPERTVQAAKSLARIYAERGDEANARKYELMAGRTPSPAVAQKMPEPASPVAPPVAPKGAPAPAPTEFDLSAEFLGEATTAPPAPPPPVEVPPDVSAPHVAETPVAPPPVQEFDLSAGFEAPAPPPEPAQAETPPFEAPAFNFEDSKVEVDYYLDQGFFDEARESVRALQEKFPGNPQVAELRARVEKRVAPKAEEVKVPDTVQPAPGGEWELPGSFAKETPAQVPPPVQEPPPPPIPPKEVPVAASPVAPPVPPPAPAPVAPPPPAPMGDPLGGLIGDLEASLEGIDTGAPAQQPAANAARPAPMAPPASGGTAFPLSGFLDDLSDGDQAAAAQDDPQTHYDLGVAFREMNLLDEAIGEFQKVVKNVEKGIYPPNFLQVCTLLALCFMDKKMPAIAIKWYLRALELPGLTEDATMAVTYDLGVAYEEAGDAKKALERFSEVYSQNIDYRDVAEKIRTMQTRS